MMILRKILNATFIISIVLVLLTVVSSPASAQFTNPTSTPTPTLTTSPLTAATSTPTPTIRVGGGTSQATTPAAGNALPTMLVFIASVAFIAFGVLIWKKQISSQSA